MSTKQAFLKGAVILAAANVLVKLIGAFYTIPLARLIDAEGMGLYSSAYQIYMWLFIVSATGLPIAISKMVSEEAAIGNYKEAHRVFKISLVLLALIGITTSLILYFGASIFVKIIGTEKAFISLLTISPCLFFVSIMAAYRGYFQGMQDMVPTAVTELIEAIFRAGLGLVFAYFLLSNGIEYSSAGAVFGVSMGSLAGMIAMFLLYRLKRKRIFEKIRKYQNRGERKRIRTIISTLLKVALPITAGASVFAIVSLIDLTMIMRRLKDIGFSETHALKMYGYLSGYAFKIYSLPTTVVIALAISIVPVIAGAYVNRNRNSVKRIVDSGFRVSLIFSIPAAVGIGLLAEPILKLLFNDTSPAKILTLLSISIVFVATVQISGAVLQGIGKVMIPVKNLLIGSGFKVVSNYFLIGIPAVNILGAPISTAICYGVVTMLNFRDIKKLLGVRYNFVDMFVKPLIASAAMGISVLYTYNSVMEHFFSNGIATMTSILVGMVIYLIVIILVGGLKKADLDMLPFGQGLTEFLYKLKLIR